MTAGGVNAESGRYYTEKYFACGLTTTIALVQYRVQQALIQWEPRIDSVNVVVTFDPPNGTLRVDVSYRIRTTNTFYNLVYPFYVQEGQA